MATPAQPIAVTAAIIERDGRVLIARRRVGDHLGGLWEFPGGKVEAGETPEACLERELEEEFGVRARIGDFVTSNVHEYKHIAVEILAYKVELLEDELKPLAHDAVAWVTGSQLLGKRLAPADVPIAQRLASEVGDRDHR